MRKRALEVLRQQAPSWADNLILAGIRGSDAHGTKLPSNHPRATDDTDTFGVSVQPIDWYLGIEGYRSTIRQSWDTAGDYFDHLIHDVRKVFTLLCKGNPNVHCWLWADPEDYLIVSPSGQIILDNRKEFLSKACLKAFGGYAVAQMRQMDRSQYKGYMGKKRKFLVEELGYDVKHAAHCIRLLNMGIELVETGEMSTRRPKEEASLLMGIKAGEWSYHKTEKLALALWTKFTKIEKTSKLPDGVDYNKINELLVKVITFANLPQNHSKKEQ